MDGEISSASKDRQIIKVVPTRREVTSQSKKTAGEGGGGEGVTDSVVLASEANTFVKRDALPARVTL